jgi:hypothetical protein
VNGDGYGDVIVGALLEDNGEVDEGTARLYYGNERFSQDALPLGPSPNPRQRRFGGADPLAPLGTSGSREGVTFQVDGRSPFGRSDVALQLELKPFGELFDGTGLQRSTYGDSSSGVPLSISLSGLEPGERYHWRMRLFYRPSTTPFQSTSPWLTLAANGPEELDFRTESDTDLDGHFDRRDNCSLVANAAQSDADGDCFGNICDADLNDSGGVVNFADLALFRAAFGNASPPADLNSSGGVVNFADLALFRSLFARLPGPSGFRPAGTPAQGCVP